MVLRFFLRGVGKKRGKGKDKQKLPKNNFGSNSLIPDYLLIASCTATATATVIPTIGLLPAPRNPIIST